MLYCAIQGYANGDTSKIWRATDTNGVVCGQSGGVAQDYPYSYFWSPLNTTSNRFCVKSCPTSTVQPDCYGTNCATISWIVVNSDGSISSPGAAGATWELLYDSEGLMGRICIPSTAVLNNALSGVVTSISSASNSGTFGNFINDLKEVQIIFYFRIGNGF